MMDSKDRILDLEQMASFAKQMYSSCSEELEEMKALIEDQATQLDEYRNKVSFLCNLTYPLNVCYFHLNLFR